MSVALRGGIAALFLFAVPLVAHADGSTLVWGDLIEDPETGEEFFDNPVNIQDGGTYEVPLNVERDARVTNDDPFIFDVEGVLFYIPDPGPDPDAETHEFVASIGGFFGVGELTWEQPGVYELDVYEVAPPVPVHVPWLERAFAFLFGKTAHAQAPGDPIDTIRFTIVEEGSCVADCFSNVLFLPGIKGSVLKTGSDTLWPPTIWSDDVAQLALDENGESVNDVYVDGVLNTFYGTPIYAPFSSFMDDLVAEGLINAWWAQPYDWRFLPEKVLEDGVKTDSGVVDIVQEVEALAASSKSGKVAIVAHSMGGLLGKALIKELEEEGKDDLIDSFVMVGVPQLGTPQAVASILHGDDEGIVAGLIVRPSTARAIAQDMPSAYNLLPSSRYFEEVGDPVITFDPDASFTQEWRDFWGPFINTYTSFFEFATGSGVSRSEPPEELLRVPEVLRPDLMTSVADFHDEFDAYEFPEHIRVVQIAGWGRPTTKAVEYRESHSFPSYKTIFTTEGDSTVVYPSATSSNSAETYFINLSLFNQNESQDTQHRDLLNIEPIQNLMEDVIEESPISGINYISETKPPLTESDTQLIVSVHSPVLLGAYDEFGNFTGIDPGQDLSEDVLFVTEDIPGSAFLYSSESQYIFLPKNGIYHFIYKGIGEGPTTVEIEDLVADIVTPIVMYSDIPTEQDTSAAFVVNGNLPEETTIEVDVDNDGEVDETVYRDGLSLNEIIVLLRTKIQELDISTKLKKKLLKKLDNLEEKIEKKRAKNAKILANLEKKVTNKNAKGMIADADAVELLELLDLLEAQAEEVSLDTETLSILREKIETLDVKKSLKKSLFKRVDKLENTQTLIKALAKLTGKVSKKAEKGEIADQDVQELLNLLEQLESAL